MTPSFKEAGKMTRQELEAELKLRREYEKKRNELGPKTPDELHAYIKRTTGMDLPRIAVCDGHTAPFDFVKELYFEEIYAALLMANRGGSKTMSSALLHLLNSKFKPRCESASIGAIEQQAFRAYDNFKKLVIADAKAIGISADLPEDHPDVNNTIMRETTWKNSSKVEVIVGTPAGVNGPHPQKVHFDEVELADPVVFQESRNMSQSAHGIRAQDWVTSTRKRAHGPMQKLIDDIHDAERQGLDPPYKLYVWCVFECAEPVKSCQVAYPDLPEGQRCECDRVVKGKWDDGSPRVFKDVCQGRLARSQGWIPLTDIHKNFRTLSQDVWEAQQECSKPSTKGLVFPMFARGRNCIRWYEPDPDNGPIYMSVDFGGTNPHAVEWIQVLKYDVMAHGYHQQRDEEPKIKLKEGSRVVFDEVYRAELSNSQLAAVVVQHEQAWRRKHPSFRITRRFYDYQAKAAMLEWAHYETPMALSSFATKDVREHVKQIRELIQDDRFYIDITRCPMGVDQTEAWHYPDKKGNVMDDPEVPVKDFDHAIDAIRYAEANIRAIERKSMQHQKTGASNDRYGVGNRTSVTGSGPARYMPRPGQHLDLAG